MFLLLLVFGRPMAVQARDAAARMRAELKLVDYGILQLGMAFRAAARGAHGVCVLAGDIGYRPFTVDEERAHNQRKPDHYGDEECAKWHYSMIAVFIDPTPW